MLADSHCHLNCLDLSLFENNIEKVLENAHAKDVGHFLCVCIDLVTFPEVLEIAKKFNNVHATVGLHPNEKVDSEPTVDELIKLAEDPKIVAIGETGLDYFRSEGDLTWQQDRFRTHIRAAKSLNKPLIVHTRDAREDTIKILREEKAEKGVLHCFTETLEMAEKAIEMNFYISFSGIVTFPNAKELREVARVVPLERMLVETDCPYLAPVPFRGKPNEPAYVRYVAEEIAKLKGLSYEVVAQQTTANYLDLFGI